MARQSVGFCPSRAAVCSDLTPRDQLNGVLHNRTHTVTEVFTFYPVSLLPRRRPRRRVERAFSIGRKKLRKEERQPRFSLYLFLPRAGGKKKRTSWVRAADRGRETARSAIVLSSCRRYDRALSVSLNPKLKVFSLQCRLISNESARETCTCAVARCRLLLPELHRRRCQPPSLTSSLLPSSSLAPSVCG